MEEKRTLSEVIETMPEDEIIFLGSQRLWFYVGEANELKKLHKAIDRQLYDTLQRQITKCKEKIFMTCRSFILAADRELKTVKDIEAKSMYLALQYNEMFHFIELRDNQKPIMEREVKMTYERIDDGTAIVLEGEETGDYSYMDEWIAKHGRAKLKAFEKEEEDDVGNT